METQFRVGDLVVRKGTIYPLMTVSKLIGDRTLCTWFDSKQKKHNGDFASAELSSPQPPSKPISIYL